MNLHEDNSLFASNLMISKRTISDKNFFDTEYKNELNNVFAVEINVNLIGNVKNYAIAENEISNDCNGIRIR